LNDENPQVRINAIEALLDYQTEDADALIKSMLFDSDEEVKRNAVIAMYNIGGEDSMHEIISDVNYSQICKDEARNLLDNIEDYE